VHICAFTWSSNSRASASVGSTWRLVDASCSRKVLIDEPVRRFSFLLAAQVHRLLIQKGRDTQIQNDIAFGNDMLADGDGHAVENLRVKGRRQPARGVKKASSSISLTQGEVELKQVNLLVVSTPWLLIIVIGAREAVKRAHRG